MRGERSCVISSNSSLSKMVWTSRRCQCSSSDHFFWVVGFVWFKVHDVAAPSHSRRVLCAIWVAWLASLILFPWCQTVAQMRCVWVGRVGVGSASGSDSGCSSESR